jgi:proteasome accessory factor A
MSEYTTYLKTGATALVLEMVEDGFIRKDFSLRNPVRALKDISRDLTCKKKLQLDDGVKASALEIQQEYYELALKYYATKPKDLDVEDILEKWGYVLRWLDEDPMHLKREIDWVIKKSLIDKYLDKQEGIPSDDKVLMMDLQYHDIRLTKGLYYLLERKQQVDRVLTDEQIRLAMVQPPQNTRAKLRGELIKLAKQKRIPYDLDWNYIRLGYLLNLWVRCNDPFQEEDEKVTLLKRRLEKTNFKYGYLL